MHTILVADDSVTIQRAVEIAFDREPFTIVKASSSHEALTRARELKPHLVLADHTMGDQSGYDLAAALKADPATSGIPVVLLSAAANPYDDGRGSAAGVVASVQKPFDCATLLDRVRGILGVPATPLGAATATSSTPSAPPSSLSGMPRPPGLGAGLPRPPSPAFPPRPAVAPPATPPVAAGAAAIPRAPTPAPSRDGFASALAQPLTPVAPTSPAPLHAPASVATVTPTGWTAVAPGQRLPSAPSADDAESDFSSLEISTLPPVTSPPASAVAPTLPPQPATPAAALPVAAASVSGRAEPPRVAATTAAAVSAVVTQASAAIEARTGEAPSREVLSAEARQIVERIAWEVVPELAETIIREELARLLKARAG
jgi:CheY-like chemotaxis protein